MPFKPINLVGKRFGRLMVLQLVPIGLRKHKWGSEWTCLCDCGQRRNVDRSSLIQNRTTSCGCFQHDQVTRYTHPTCHPDRKHQAHGLCEPCYRVVYNDAFRVENTSKRHHIPDMDGVRRVLKQKSCFLCGKTSELHVDHNHKTGIVRERLCGSCNRGLGIFKDDPNLLRRAAVYLESH